MLASGDYDKIINWQLKHHKVKRFSIGRFIIWRSMTVKDVRKIPQWYSKFTSTERQDILWQEKVFKFLKEKLPFTDEYLKRQIGWVVMNHGLRVDNSGPEIHYHYEL